MSEIKDIIAKSYKVAGAHIEHDIEVCNEIYTIGPENGKIIAFFMVGYHIIHNLQCCYLGLSVCNREYRDYGLWRCFTVG